MKTNEIKDQVQKQAIQAIRQNNGRGLIAIATGGGKSKIAIDYMKEYHANGSKTLLVVPTEKLRDVNWQKEFTRWRSLNLYGKLDRTCYASLKNLEGNQYDLVILDELHNITELNSTFFEKNHCRDIIGLSATPPQDVIKQRILNSIGMKTVFHVPIDEAVKIGLVAPYQLYLIEMKLNETKKYIKAGNKKNPFFTTEKKNYDYLTDKIVKARRRNAGYKELKFLYLERMRMIYNLKSKVYAAKHVLNTIIPKDDRLLIFAGSIDVAEQLEPQTFHSKSTDEHFNAFMKGEINRLSAVKALNEGVDIENLDSVFIVQLNSNEKDLIQRMGRAVRHREGHEAKIYVLYVKDTVDEDWLYKATRNIDLENSRTIKVNVT